MSDTPETTLDELLRTRAKLREAEARIIDLQFEPASLAASNLRLQDENARLREELAHAERAANILRVIAGGIVAGETQLFFTLPEDSEAYDLWLVADRERKP